MENYCVNVDLKQDGAERISRLCGRLGQCPEDIVRTALKFYEDAVNAMDESRSRARFVSMSMEVKKDG